MSQLQQQHSELQQQQPDEQQQLKQPKPVQHQQQQQHQSQLQQQHSALQQRPDEQQQQQQQQQKQPKLVQHQEQQQQQQHHQRGQPPPQQHHCQQEEEQNTFVMSKIMQWQKQVLSKILGEGEAKNVLHCGKVASEENVEVMDLTLNQNERLILYLSCKHFFNQDAWSAVRSNIKYRSDATGIILPVYNATEDPYWLFNFPGKLDVVLNARPTTKIAGYWLDSCDTQKELYQLMSNRSKIVGRNIIKTEHGPVYYICDSEVFSRATWKMSPIFNDTIIKLLP